MIPRLREILAALGHRWRGSLLLRVAATTLVLSAIVVALVGLVLQHQIRNGLLQAKARSSLNQLDFGLQHAADQFGALDVSRPNAVQLTASQILQDLSSGTAGSPYGVVLLATDQSEETQEASPRTWQSSRNDLAASIPANLRNVVTHEGREAWTYARIVHKDGTSEPGLVVGGIVPTQSTAAYQLYYRFPLNQERDTLALVQRTMLLAGAAIVALLVVITLLVARQVVRPVRQAAATAERLAAGRLRDRMRVRGEDDLASLATSFNRMAETVERQISQLRELSRVQRRFVADVSHELRTPITTIRMAADVLHESRDELTPELARSSELLQQQLDRFEFLLGDLLEISRHDAGAAALDIDTVDLRSLVTRVAEMAAPLAERGRCPVVLDLPTEPVVVDVDPRRVERVLRNLVANAVEHGAGQPVDVRLRGGPGGVAVSVRDRGPGLRPGEASLVFGRFWRADPARARTGGGTGLGLSIALEDARLHGGWLQAWGQAGFGSVFRLTLPWRAGDHITESPLSLEGDIEEVVAPQAASTSTASTAEVTGG